MAESSLPVEFLFSIDVDTSAPTMISGAPQGNRYIVSVPGGTFEGPKMKGTVVPNSGGDWLTLRADGSAKLDVRLTLQTDDGAHILMSYNGILVNGASGPSIRGAPLFETGAEKYTWLNLVQAVGIGAPRANGVKYDIYALS